MLPQIRSHQFFKDPQGGNKVRRLKRGWRDKQDKKFKALLKQVEEGEPVVQKVEPLAAEPPSFVTPDGSSINSSYEHL